MKITPRKPYRITVRITEEERNALSVVADRYGLTVSDVARLYIIQAVIRERKEVK